ncbi:hypothetical protein [Rhizobium sp. NXC24]|uniref:hypothetical protein n=1 Tax=Rhizobium sp. NXC24 TaxID=2048897 RepID=UPI000CF2B4D3|nr:hypothetical protein [Rhizobium sp. NXC24]
MTFAAYAAGTGIVVALLTNGWKLYDWTVGGLAYAAEQSATAILLTNIGSNFIARRKIAEIYEGRACFQSAQPVALDEDGRQNDLIAWFFFSPDGTCQTGEYPPPVSAAVFAFRKNHYEFAGDFSGYGFIGLDVENDGPFLIATPSQSSVPIIEIFALEGKKLRKVARVDASIDDGDGESEVKFDHKMVDGCLVVIAAAENQRHICPNSGSSETNDLSFDRFFGIADDGKLTVDGNDETPDGADRSVYGVYIDPFDRLWLPGSCDPVKNVSESNVLAFFGSYHISDLRAAPESDGTANDVIGKLTCGNIKINLKASGW